MSCWGRRGGCLWTAKCPLSLCRDPRNPEFGFAPVGASLETQAWGTGSGSPYEAECGPNSLSVNTRVGEVLSGRFTHYLVLGPLAARDLACRAAIAVQISA